MRNIFDQYSQPENRITHALMTALNEDRALLGHFLRDLAGVDPPRTTKSLTVVVQRYPGEMEERAEEADRRGIPDAWVHDGDDWCLAIETKVLAPLSSDQIKRHRMTAGRLGFRRVELLAITPRVEAGAPAECTMLQWRDVYSWLLCNAHRSRWADRAARYLEVAEAQMTDRGQLIEGTLTMFSGIPFGKGRPFNYFEAKRLLGLAMAELKQRPDLRNQLGIDVNASGRGRITGSQGDSVWDLVRFATDARQAKHTANCHLTLKIGTDDVSAGLIIPDKVNGSTRRKLRAGQRGVSRLDRPGPRELRAVTRQASRSVCSAHGIATSLDVTKRRCVN